MGSRIWVVMKGDKGGLTNPALQIITPQCFLEVANRYNTEFSGTLVGFDDYVSEYHSCSSLQVD